jgi:dihydroxyacetone kinase-like protein
MLTAVSWDELVAMFRGAARQIRENHETLSALDSFAGDGDHGTTMMRAVTELEKVIESATPADMSSLLNDSGWAVMGIDGGATGPLFGSLFLGMADSIQNTETLDPATVVAMFEAGLAGVQKRTKAQVGDKTLMDALVPAVQALKEAVEEGADIAEALHVAAKAAEQGAVSTKDLQARFGRARNLGEKSIGEQDPGATSISLILGGFAEGLGQDLSGKAGAGCRRS